MKFRRGGPLKAEDYVTQIILSVVEAARSKVNILYERRTCEVCMYDDIAEETGYADRTLRLVKETAEKIESGRRLPELSFSHHVEVASLPPSGSTRSTHLFTPGLEEVIKRVLIWNPF